MSRINDAGYTTSGRNSTGKSSAIKKAAKAPAKKAAPKAAVKVAAKGKFPSSMSVPGSARPSNKASVTISRPSSIPATGRDRFGASARPDKTKFMNRQESEAKIMSAMRRDRLGPGQR